MAQQSRKHCGWEVWFEKKKVSVCEMKYLYGQGQKLYYNSHSTKFDEMCKPLTHWEGGCLWEGAVLKLRGDGT